MDFWQKHRNHTPIVLKFMKNIHSPSSIRYSNDIRLSMIYCKQQRGSPWINTFGEVENWLSDHENQHLNLDNIKRPNTKWVFGKFSNIAGVKVVLARQQLLSAGPLPDWLCNVACRRVSKMILLDTSMTTCVFGAA